MLRQRLIGGGLVLFLLTFCPGCHVLVRLGEPPEQQKQAEASPADEEQETTGPPPPAGLMPGEDAEDSATPPPPAPGLDPPQVQDETSSPTAASSNPSRPKRLNSNTGINTNTAIAPGLGQTVYRTQIRFLEAHSNPAPAKVDVNQIVIPNVLAYGVRENFTLFGVVPTIFREGTVRPPAPPGAFSDLDDQGIADLRFFGKYRFWEKDLPGETYRWSVLGGLEVPTYDQDFSSDSWDPFLGTVWTYQSLEWGLDLDTVWQSNTGQGSHRHDTLAYDAAYTYVLLTGQTLDEHFWQLNSVFEINGTYIADGSHLVFASPGFQLALERMIVEASLQLPVLRDLKAAIEPDFVFVIGTRITW